ncbi:LysR family transcriptional regulator [Paenibacillus sp. 1781tsa1]|uniref:LysR family transcriptional regulator n=1 Tax=Paenibacillus sp. 1781tsa1 TaxID=2953810 RepID=UPI00209F6BB4|nr:LysR family transcriptional regulator [Paenibacillus sp. 1781tsa1]MCP1184637.1 LysR family transcriptional regulator [Paenibacillus sp. 1781tsa1]
MKVGELMEIRHFITFRKVIQLGSFTQAAEHLGYTQSTVTSHIQALEEHLGASLFDRMGRKVRLTDIGKKLLHYTQEILDTYEKIESITNDGDDIRGELRIAAPESLTVYRLEPILREYRNKFLYVSIILSNATCGDNKRAILHGSADIAFLMMPTFQDADFIVHSLMDEPIVLVGSHDNPLNVLDQSYENQKLNECLITNEKECSYRTMFEGYLRERGIVLSNTMELWSIEAIKRCVMSGLGIACLPLITVNNEIKDGRLKVIPCEGDHKQISAQMVYHKNKWVSPALSKFIEITLKHTRDWSYE